MIEYKDPTSPTKALWSRWPGRGVSLVDELARGMTHPTNVYPPYAMRSTIRPIRISALYPEKKITASFDE